MRGVDLFCGAGGLSYGLKDAGIEIAAGIDIDDSCGYPYEFNVKAKFIKRDIREIAGQELSALWGDAPMRLLAGCAPCQPFSSHRRGEDTSDEDQWGLLREFQRLVEQCKPEYVTMENVPRLRSASVFEEFRQALERIGYHISWGSLYGPDFGLPQERRRLVLIGSLLGDIALPKGRRDPASYATVREAIGGLPALAAGESDPNDALHYARRLSPLNLERIRASRPGGTWLDWPEELRVACHKKESGRSFSAFYGRMNWNTPAPTITTQSYNFGTGRFGHPEQDRSLTLRESAMLQGFPQHYTFTPPGHRPAMATIGRLIGNAVPPPFGYAIGQSIVEHASLALRTERAALTRGDHSEDVW